MYSYLTLVKNMFFLFLARGIDVLFPFLIIPILINRLGMDNYGIIAMSMSFATYVGVFIQYGFLLSGTREIAKNSGNKHKVSKVFSQYFVVTHIVGFVIITIGLVVLFFLGLKKSTIAIYSFALLYILFYSLIPIWLFQGLEKFKNLVIINVFCKVIYICLIYFFINTEKDLVYINLFNFLSILLNYLLSLIYIFLLLGIKLVPIQKSIYALLLKRDIYIFLNQLLPNLYNNFSVFYLGMIFGSFYAGLLQSAMAFSEGAISLFRIMINVIYPTLVKYKDSFYIFSKYILIFIFIYYLLYNIIIILVIPRIFPETFESLLLYSQILGVSIIFASIYLFWGVTYSLINDKEREITSMIFKVSLISSISVFSLVPIYGMYAVLLAIVLSRFLFAIFSLRLFLKDINLFKFIKS